MVGISSGFSNRTPRLFLEIGAIVLILAGHGHADVAVRGFKTLPLEPPCPCPTWGTASADTFGWSFTVLQPIRVKQLGFYDFLVDGLAVSHRVGLWDSAGRLLADVILAAGTGAEMHGEYRYADADTVVLVPGQMYAIAATVPSAWDPFGGTFEVPDQYPLYNIDLRSVDMSPDIGYVESRRGDGGGHSIPTVPPWSLTYPSEPAGADAAFLGPNLRFDIVPEPTTLALLGCAWAVFWRDRAKGHC